MYPRVTDLFRDLFGFEFPIPLYSFGLMVATAILTATWMARIELDRLYARGLVPPVRAEIKDAKGRTKTASVSPSVHIWTLMGIVAVAGIVGSKLAYIVDHWEEFAQAPVQTLLSGSGLAFYGGLILATVLGAWYAHRKGIVVPRLADAAAPGILVAYGIGRMGCYLAGDGDWGLCSSLADKPAWIPGWLWSETFPRAFVYNAQIQDPVTFNAVVRDVPCTLPEGAVTGVYPTMLYETVIACALGGLLWLARKHPYKAGWLFSVFLILQGLERFFIEFLRTNREWLFGLSQSQWISIVLITLGVIGVARLTRRQPAPPAEPEAKPVAA